MRNNLLNLFLLGAPIITILVVPFFWLDRHELVQSFHCYEVGLEPGFALDHGCQLEDQEEGIVHQQADA